MGVYKLNGVQGDEAGCDKGDTREVPCSVLASSPFLGP